MSPRHVTKRLALAGGKIRIVVKLIVPDHVAVSTVIDFIESGADWISGAFAETTVVVVQCRIGATGGNGLQTEIFGIVLYLSTEYAGALRIRDTAWEKFCVELEYKPPIDR